MDGSRVEFGLAYPKEGEEDIHTQPTTRAKSRGYLSTSAATTRLQISEPDGTPAAKNSGKLQPVNKKYLERCEPVPDPLWLPEQNLPLSGDIEADRQVPALIQ